MVRPINIEKTGNAPVGTNLTFIENDVLPNTSSSTLMEQIGVCAEPKKTHCRQSHAATQPHSHPATQAAAS